MSRAASRPAAQRLTLALLSRSGEVAPYRGIVGTLQRVSAEYANYRRRTERERGELANTAKAKFATPLLPLLDDLDLASGYCGEVASSTATPPATSSTTLPPAIYNLTCDFENGNTCGWSVTNDHWRLLSGEDEALANWGPQTDVTTDLGSGELL